MEDVKSACVISDQVEVLTTSTDIFKDSQDLSGSNETQVNLFNAVSITEDIVSPPQQQANCKVSETPRRLPVESSDTSFKTSSSLDIHQSLNNASSSHISSSGTGHRNRSQSGGDDGSRASSELVLQLQRLCKRQRQRSEDRSFVRDVERVLELLKVHAPTSADTKVTSATFPGPGMRLEMLGSVQEADSTSVEKKIRSKTSNRSTLSSMSSRDVLLVSRVTLTLSEIDALLDCIADLFDHRNVGVRALAFEVVQVCLLRFGEILTPDLRRKIFLRLETHPPGDFLLRQTALRALTQDGRHLEPFQVEMGWFILRLLEQSDAQRDLLGLIQNVLRRSPRALDRDKVIAIVSVISARCGIAWNRGDFDACHNFVVFFHALATHNSAYAASTPACLRSLCCLVNAGGHETWSVMKLLLNGNSGFLVLRGLIQVLEHPTGADSPWVLRGAVFFVGMSCWGSQRVAKFDDIAWAPILLALEQALQCCRGVVIFEVILSLQRLIKKFGATHQSASGGQSAASSMAGSSKPTLQSEDSSHDASETSLSSTSCASNNKDKRYLVMEWDIVLRMLQALRPWVSMTHENELEDYPQQTSQSDNRRTETNGSHHPATLRPTNNMSGHLEYARG